MADVSIQANEAFLNFSDLEGDISSQKFSITPNLWVGQVFLSRTDELDKIFFLCDNTEALEVELYTALVSGGGQVFTPDFLLASVSHPENGASPFQDISVGNQSNSGGIWRKITFDTPISLVEGAFYIIVFKTTSTSKSPTIFWTANYRQSINPIITASNDAGATWSNDNIETITAGNTQAGAVCFGYVGKEVDTITYLDSGTVTIGGTVSSRRGYSVFLYVENLDPLSTTVGINFSQLPPSDPINGTSEETDQAMMRWYFFEEGILPVSADFEPVLFKTNVQAKLDINAEFVLYIQPDRISPLADTYYPESEINTYANPIGLIPIYSSTKEFIDFDTPSNASDENVNMTASTDVTDRFGIQNWAHLKNKAKLETSGNQRLASSSQNPSYFDFSTENPSKDVEIIKTITLDGTLDGIENEEDVTRGFNRSEFLKNKYIFFSKKAEQGYISSPSYPTTPGKLLAYVADSDLINWERKTISVLDSSPSTLGLTFGDTASTYIIGVYDSVVVAMQGVETLFVLFQTISFSTIGSATFPSGFHIGYYQGDFSESDIQFQLINHELTDVPNLADVNFSKFTVNNIDEQKSRFIFPNNSEILYFSASNASAIYGLGIWKINLTDSLSSIYEAERLKVNSDTSIEQTGISDEKDKQITFVLYDGNTTYLGIRTSISYTFSSVNVPTIGSSYFARVYRTDDFTTFEQLLGGEAYNSASAANFPSWLSGIHSAQDYDPTNEGVVWPQVGEDFIPSNEVKFMHKVGNILHVWTNCSAFTSANTPIHVAIDIVSKSTKVLRLFPIEDEADSSYGTIPKVSDLELYPRSKALRWIEGGSVNGNHIFIYGAESLTSSLEPATMSASLDTFDYVADHVFKSDDFKTRWLIYDDRTINDAFEKYNSLSDFIGNAGISSILFEGTGNDDINIGGTYSGTTFDERYLIEVENKGLVESFTAGVGIGNGPLDDFNASGTPTATSQKEFIVEIDRIAEVGTGTVANAGVGSLNDPSAGFAGSGSNDAQFTTLLLTPLSPKAIGVEITSLAAADVFTGSGLNDLTAQASLNPGLTSQEEFKVEIDSAGLIPNNTGLTASASPAPTQQKDYHVEIVEDAGTEIFLGSGQDDLNATVTSPSESYTYQIEIEKLAYEDQFDPAIITSVVGDDLEAFGNSTEGYLYQVEIVRKAMDVETVTGTFLDDFQVTRQVVFNGTGTNDFEIVESLSQDGIEYNYDILIEIDGLTSYKLSTDGGATFASALNPIVANTPFNVASSGWRGQFTVGSGYVVGDKWSFQTVANVSAVYKVEIDSIGLDPAPDTSPANGGIDDLSASTSGGGPLDQFLYEVEITDQSARNVSFSNPRIATNEDGIFTANQNYDPSTSAGALIKALGNIPENRDFDDLPFGSDAIAYRTEIDGKALDASVYGSYLYTISRNIVSNSIFKIINTSHLDNIPSPLSTTNVSVDGIDFVVSGNYAYIISTSLGDNSLEIYDVSDKTSPMLLSTLDLGIFVSSVISIIGDTVYLVSNVVPSLPNSSSINLIVINVGNPLNPYIRSVTRSTGGGSASALFSSKPLPLREMVYLSQSSTASFFIVNDKDIPLNIGPTDNTFDGGSGQTGIEALDDRLYVASSNNRKVFVYNDLSSMESFVSYVLLSGGPFFEGEMIVKTSSTPTAGANATILTVVAPFPTSGELKLGNASQLTGITIAPSSQFISGDTIFGVESGATATLSSGLTFKNKDASGANQTSTVGFRKAATITTFGLNPNNVHPFNFLIKSSEAIILSSPPITIDSFENSTEFTFTVSGTTATISGNITAQILNGSTVKFYNLTGGSANILFVTYRTVRSVTYNSGPNTTTFTISSILSDRTGGKCFKIVNYTLLAVSLTGTNAGVEIYDMTNIINLDASLNPLIYPSQMLARIPLSDLSGSPNFISNRGDILYISTSAGVDIFEISRSSIVHSHENLGHLIAKKINSTSAGSTIGRLAVSPISISNNVEFIGRVGPVSFTPVSLASSAGNNILQAISVDGRLSLSSISGFNAGDTITGLTSGATAIVFASTIGSTAYGNLNGKFILGETISSSGGGSASNFGLSNPELLSMKSGKYIIKATSSTQYVYSTDGGKTFTTTPILMLTSFAGIGSTGVSIRFESTTTHVAGDIWEFEVGPNGIFDYKVEIDSLWNDSLIFTGSGLDDLKVFGDPTNNIDVEITIDGTAEQFGYGYGFGLGGDFFNIFGFAGPDYGYGGGSFEYDYAYSYDYGLGYEYGYGYPFENNATSTDTFSYVATVNSITIASGFQIPITEDLQNITNGIQIEFGSKGKFSEDYLFTLFGSASPSDGFQIIKLDSIYSDLTSGAIVETQSVEDAVTLGQVSIACDENLMIIGNQTTPSVYIYNTRDPENTHLVGVESVVQNCEDIRINDNLLFIGGNSGGNSQFVIYDLTYAQVSELVEDDVVNLSDPFVNIRIKDDYAFVLVDDSVNIILQSWDISNPISVPVSPDDTLSLSFTSGGADALSSTISGNYHYSAGNVSGTYFLKTVDITNPTALVLSSSISFESSFVVFSITSTNNFLYITGHRTVPINAERLVKVYDIVSTPGTPVFTGEYKDSFDGADSRMTDIKAKDGIVYTMALNNSTSASSLYIIDVSQPTNPSLLTSILVADYTVLLNLCTLTRTQGHTYGDKWNFSSRDTFRWTDDARRPVTIWNEEEVEINSGIQNIDNLTAVLFLEKTAGYALGDTWDFSTVDTFRWAADITGTVLDISDSSFEWQEEKIKAPFEGGVIDLESTSPFDNPNVKLDFFDSNGYFIGDFIDWSYTQQDSYSVRIYEFNPLLGLDVIRTSPFLITPTTPTLPTNQLVTAGSPVSVAITSPEATGPVFVEFDGGIGHKTGDKWTFTTLDTFRWTDKVFPQLIDNDPISGFVIQWNETKVPIMTDVLTLYSLNNNVDITIGNKNGHDIGDAWIFSTVDTFKYSVGDDLDDLSQKRTDIPIPLEGGISSIGKQDTAANDKDSENNVFIDSNYDVGHSIGDKWTFSTTDAFRYIILNFGYGYGFGSGADYFDVFGHLGGFVGYGWDTSNQIGTNNQLFESVNASQYGYGTGYEYGFGQYGFSFDIDINCIPIKLTNNIGNGVVLDFSNLSGHSGNEIWQFSSSDKFVYNIDGGSDIGPINVSDDFVGVENGISIKFNSLSGFSVGDSWDFKTIDTFKYYEDNVLIASNINLSTSSISLESYMSISFGNVTGHTVGNYWTFDALDEFTYEVKTLPNTKTLNDSIVLGSTITGSTSVITGISQPVGGGSDVDVTFTNQNGHTLGDKWRIANVDSYKWSDNNGLSYTILKIATSTPSLLSNGISASFPTLNNLRNHNVGDKWTFDALDEIKWSKNNGSTFEASGLPALISPTTSIGSGLNFSFDASLGHDIGDIWTFHPVPKIGYQLVEGKGVYHGKTIAIFDHDETARMFSDYPALSPDLSTLSTKPRAGIYCGLVNYAGSSVDNIEFDNSNTPESIITANGITYIISENDDDGIRAFKTYGIKELPQNWGKSFQTSLGAQSTITAFEKIDIDKANFELAVGGPSTFVNIIRRGHVQKINGAVFISEIKKDSLSAGFDNVNLTFPNRSILAISNTLRRPQEITAFFNINYLGDIESDVIGGVPVADILSNIEASNTNIFIKCAETIEKLFEEPKAILDIPLAQDVDGSNSTRSLISNTFQTDTENNFFRIESNNLLSDDSGSGNPRELVDLKIKGLRLHDITLQGPEENTNNMKVAVTGIIDEGSGVPENALQNGVHVPSNGEIIVDFNKPIYLSEISFDVEYFGTDLAGANQSQFSIYALTTFHNQKYGNNIIDKNDWTLIGSPEFVSLTGNQDSISKDAIGMFVKSVRIFLNSGVTLKVKNLSFKSFTGSSDQFSSSGDVKSPEMITIDDPFGILVADISGMPSSFAVLNSDGSNITIDLEENVPVTRISLGAYSGNDPTKSLKIESWDGATTLLGSPVYEILHNAPISDYELSVVQWTPRLKDKSREVQVIFLSSGDIESESQLNDLIESYNKPENSALLANSGLSGFVFKPNTLKDRTLTITSSKESSGEFDGSIFVNAQMDEDGPFASDLSEETLGLIEKKINVDFPLRQIRKIKISLTSQMPNNAGVRVNGLKIYSPIVDETGTAEFPRTGVAWTIRLTASIITQ